MAHVILVSALGPNPFFSFFGGLLIILGVCLDRGLDLDQGLKICQGSPPKIITLQEACAINKICNIGQVGLLSICDKILTGKSICCYFDWPGDYRDQFRRQ